MAIHLTRLPMNQERAQIKLGFWLFVASLSSFFIACVVAYLIIRFFYEKPEDQRLVLPAIFYASTGLLIAASYALHQSVVSVRREKQVKFRNWLRVAGFLALLFLMTQAVGLRDLATIHLSFYAGEAKLYGISSALIFIHACHVLGGIAFIGVILWGSYRHKYDHEYNWPVELCAGYWHYLDVVWIIMLLTFLIAQ